MILESVLLATEIHSARTLAEATWASGIAHLMKRIMVVQLLENAQLLMAAANECLSRGVPGERVGAADKARGTKAGGQAGGGGAKLLNCAMVAYAFQGSERQRNSARSYWIANTRAVITANVAAWARHAIVLLLCFLSRLRKLTDGCKILLF